MSEPAPPADSQDTPPLSPAQKRRFMAMAAGLVLFFVLAVAEIGVRLLLRYNSPDTLRENSLQYRPSTFTRHLLRPEQEIDLDAAWGVRKGEQGSGRSYRVNGMGFRGAPFEAEKPPGACRLVIVGGSAVFDLGADEGEDWPHLVERALRDAGNRGVEVINAGVPGHASFDAVGKIYGQLWLYEPDAVLFYNAWNDIKSFTELDRDRPLVWQIPTHDPTADPFQSYQGWLDRLLGHSQLYIKLRTRYLLSRHDVGPEGAVDAERAENRRISPLAFDQYRLNVSLVVDAARNLGATPVLLTQASLLAADNTEADRARIRYGYQGLDHDELVETFETCNRIVREVGAAKEAEVLDLAADLSGRSELFDDHIHTSREGSAALAAAVAEFLEPRLGEICGGETERANLTRDP